MTVTLNRNEIIMAAFVGVRRQCESVLMGSKDANYQQDSGWQAHIEGALGEMAFAKALGLYWDGSVNTFKTAADVGAIQVRTRSKPHYELIVRDNDRNDDLFALVRGKCPTYQIVGFIKCGQAKRFEWKKAHGGGVPAYFVPDSALTKF